MSRFQSFKSLRLDQVGRDFGAMNALKSLALQVQLGAFIALPGPSGCGKSTALNCIAGLLQPRAARSGATTSGSTSRARRIAASAW